MQLNEVLKAMRCGTKRKVLRYNNVIFGASSSGCAVAQLEVDDRAARAGRSGIVLAVPRNCAFCSHPNTVPPLRDGEQRKRPLGFARDGYYFL